MAKPLKLVFENKSGVPDDHVYIGFRAHSADIADTFGNPVKSNRDHIPEWTPLSKFTAPKTDAFVVNSIDAGRIYVCYSPDQAPAKDFAPEPTINTSTTFYHCFDKFEMTYTGSEYDVANLTSIDFWAIPLSLTSLHGKTSIKTLNAFKGSTTSTDVYNALSKLTTPPQSGLEAQGDKPVPAIVPGDFDKSKTKFARIIGPSLYPPFYITHDNPNAAGHPITPYITFGDYLKWLDDNFGKQTTLNAVVPTLGAGKIARIKDHFVGVGKDANTPITIPQDYDLVASIESEDGSYSITLTGTVSPNGQSTDLTMKFSAGDLLNADGIYGGNAEFYLNGASTPIKQDNNVYSRISGDLFAGLNCGAVGSTAALKDGTMVGALNSEDWFKESVVPKSMLFEGLQADQKDNYNPWAATMAKLSDAYNFAYAERFASVQLPVYGIDTLQVTLEPHEVYTSS
ncbi:hypothetical protein LPB41_13620 [Thalassospira sp. MA62]|nr:hypothetical protein [Thalassospira sp. MA62]